MNSRIVYKSAETAKIPIFSELHSYLPEQIKHSLDRTDFFTKEKMCEIRLRCGAVCSATADGETLFFGRDGISRSPAYPIKLSERDIDEFIYRICGGSVYSYENSMKSGYITVRGARIGICGDVIYEKGEISGFSKIYGLNIRIPRHIDGCSAELMRYIEKRRFHDGGILVASCPGVGKTTLLRDLAIKLSAADKTPFYRVAVVDERCEIYIPQLFENCCADVYSGISKSDGLEYAIRVMSPEIIICDEIGSEKESRIIRSANLGGVSFIASVHADSVKTVLNNQWLRELCGDGVFSEIYILKRNGGKVTGTLYSVNGEPI